MSHGCAWFARSWLEAVCYSLDTALARVFRRVSRFIFTTHFHYIFHHYIILPSAKQKHFIAF